mmetsp:Transcript_14730/g.18842  ORF Transcript_14730/g.18842 Transcript_14730/m.18842 type:complete len:878 (-) Transcript_14730:355-2988(-)
MSVIGIDLGNLNAVVAQAGRGGIDILLNENSNRLNPSMVSFNGAQRFMGESAASIARSNYRNTIHSIKKLIGRKWNDPETQAEIPLLPFDVVEISNGNIGVKVQYNDEEKVVCIEHVMAMMLIKLKSIAVKANNGVMVADSVISVPSWFSDTHRRAMKNACEIADVNCLRLMNETTATALSYGIFKSHKGLLDKEKPTNVMFIDMGHSAYSCTLVSFIQGSLTVKSCVYDHNIGGRDMDKMIVNYLAEEFKKKYGHDPTTSKKAMLKLYQSAERGKKQLSPLGVKEVQINVECLMEDIDFSHKLTLENYEELIAPLCERVAGPIQQVLSEAGNLSPSQVDAVEIVGGATRVPAVKRAIAAALGLEVTPPNFGLSTTLNADEAIARGCALQCAILSSRFKVKDFVIHDAVPYPVRLSWDPAGSEDTMVTEDPDEESVENSNELVIFQRNEETPKTRRVTFRRSKAFNITANYEASAAEMLPPGTNLHLADFHVEGIPNDKEPRTIRVNVKHDINGIVGISSAQMMEEVDPGEESPKNKDSPKKTDSQKQEDSKNTPKENGEKMDTSEEGKKDAASEETPAESPSEKAASEPNTPETPGQKKKKFRKRELQVSVIATGLSKTEVLNAKAEEAQMAAKDKLIQETADKRNELESYIYSMRDRIIDALRPYLEDAVKDDFSKKLEDAEGWLYSDEGFDTTKAEYGKRLNELKSIGDPVEKLLWEHTYRESTVKQLVSLIEEYKALANTVDEKYAHIAEEERNKVRTECENTQKWLYDTMETQNSLPLYAQPALPVSLIQEKSQALRNICFPIVTKPKPAPKKEEKKDEEKEKEKKGDAESETKSEDKKDDDSEPVPMETENGAQPQPETDDSPMDETTGDK